jgi:hypothetical protein
LIRGLIETSMVERLSTHSPRRFFTTRTEHKPCLLDTGSHESILSPCDCEDWSERGQKAPAVRAKEVLAVPYRMDIT